jgi:hypothetical protein
MIDVADLISIRIDHLKSFAKVIGKYWWSFDIAKIAVSKASNAMYIKTAENRNFGS